MIKTVSVAFQFLTSRHHTAPETAGQKNRKLEPETTGGEAFVHRFDSRCQNFVEVFLHPVAAGDPLDSETPVDIDRLAFPDDAQIRDVSPFPGGHIVPGGFDDRFVVPALVRKVGDYGEMRDLGVSDRDHIDIADVSADFDSVQLFHNSSLVLAAR